MVEWKERSVTLWGEEAVNRLAASRVAVIRLGGVGSFAAEAVARCGVGYMLLVDRDRVDVTNINRQLPALHSTVGKYKTDVMKERIQDINPRITVTEFREAYNAETSEKILNGRLDFVVDAIDSVPDKLHLIETCWRRGIPFISAMGMANRLDPAQIRLADLSKTEVCPLCKKIRYELRKKGITKGVPVVYSAETPGNAAADKKRLGSCAFVPSVAGLYLASAVIRSLAGKA